MNRQYVYSALIAFVVSSVCIGLFIVLHESEKTFKIEHIQSTPSSKAVYTFNEDNDLVPLDFTQTAEKVLHSVVHIKSTQIVNTYREQPYQYKGVPEPFRDFFKDDLFPFFGPDNRQDNKRGNPSPPTRMGSGSGVIVSEDGYILTNNHVIDQADDIEVTLQDNRTYKALVIGTDPTTDLALIQIKETGLEPIRFVNSDEVKIGEWVLAAGNPFSLNSTVTAGIVTFKKISLKRNYKVNFANSLS